MFAYTFQSSSLSTTFWVGDENSIGLSVVGKAEKISSPWPVRLAYRPPPGRSFIGCAIWWCHWAEATKKQKRLCKHLIKLKMKQQKPMYTNEKLFPTSLKRAQHFVSHFRVCSFKYYHPYDLWDEYFYCSIDGIPSLYNSVATLTWISVQNLII